jgi:hypothetical protein
LAHIRRSLLQAVDHLLTHQVTLVPSRSSFVMSGRPTRNG